MSANSPSGKRPLTAEEAELWAFAMREAKALRRERDKHEASLLRRASPDVPAPPAAKTAPAEHGFSDKTGVQAAPARQGERSSSSIKSPPPLARYNERERRKLARDAELIDARLDLHGMRQREAHGALKRFLLACHTRGDRHVLVGEVIRQPGTGTAATVLIQPSAGCASLGCKVTASSGTLADSIWITG